MTQLLEDKKNKRSPLSAVVLSLVMPGLGHIYCGRIVKGLLLAFLSSVFISAVIFVPVISVKSPASHFIVQAVTIAVSVVSMAIYLIAVIDSWYAAKHTAPSYQLKDYNKWYVYVLLVLMGTGGSVQLSFNVRSNIVTAFKQAGPSSYPTMLPGDRFLVNRLAYNTADPKRGDIIVFLSPQNRRMKYIKRVVALAGDTVEIRNGELYINNEKLQRNMLPQSVLENLRIEVENQPLNGDIFEEMNGSVKYKIFLAKPPFDKMSGDFAKITVPQYHCFVLADNRYLSEDSRNFGPVPLTAIVGKANYLYWPVKTWSRLGPLN